MSRERKSRAKADAAALEVLCRVFDDGADEGYQEWREWYKPEKWLSWPRALGAFIWRRLGRKATGCDLADLHRAHSTLRHLACGPVGADDYRDQARAVEVALAIIHAAGAASSPPEERTP